MHRPCSFWADDGSCKLRDCAVEACPLDKLPNFVEPRENMIADEPPKERATPDCDADEAVNIEAEALGSIDGTITDQMLNEFKVWEKHDELEDNFCYLENETDPDAIYVDLTLNPERLSIDCKVVK